MAPSIPSRYIKIPQGPDNFAIDIKNDFQLALSNIKMRHPHLKHGNHDYLGINKQAARIQSYQSRTPQPAPDNK